MKFEKYQPNNFCLVHPFQIDGVCPHCGPVVVNLTSRKPQYKEWWGKCPICKEMNFICTDVYVVEHKK